MKTLHGLGLIVLVLALFSTKMDAGLWDDITNAMSNAFSTMKDSTVKFFKSGFNKVEDLFDSDETKLKEKLEYTVDYLKGIKAKKTEMLKVYKDDAKTKAAIEKVDDFIARTEKYQTDLAAAMALEAGSDKDTKLALVKEQWKTESKKMYDDEGLNLLLAIAKNSATKTVASLALSLVLAVLFI